MPLFEFMLLGAGLLFLAVGYLKFEDYSSQGKFGLAMIWGTAGLIFALTIAIEIIRRIEMLR